MKYTFLIFTCFSILACQPNTTIQYYPSELSTSQFFNIRSDKDTSLVGAKGTILQFKANSFQTTDGKNVDGLVRIELKEFNTIEDFINNRLSTNTTDGKILRSSGMVFIQATSNTNDLKLKSNNPMTIKFQRIQESRTANLFSGEKGNLEEIRWSLLEPVYNDTVILQSYEVSMLAYGAEHITMNIKFLIGQDTIELNDGNRKEFESILERNQVISNLGIESDLTSNLDSSFYRNQNITEPNRFYIFETTELGFINCDIFIDEELSLFPVQLNNCYSDVYIILDSLNSILIPDSINPETNEYIFSLPTDKPISIFAYRKDKNKHFMAIQKTNSSIRSPLIEQEEKSLDLIRKEVKELSKNAS